MVPFMPTTHYTHVYVGQCGKYGEHLAVLLNAGSFGATRRTFVEKRTADSIQEPPIILRIAAVTSAQNGWRHHSGSDVMRKGNNRGSRW